MIGEMISLLVGGITGGTLVSAVLVRRTQKEKNEIDNNIELWDRTYKLIENLENQLATSKQQVETLKGLYAAEKGENKELRKVIERLEMEIAKMEKELEEYKEEAEEGKE